MKTSVSKGRFARIAGALYLAYFIVTILSDRFGRIGMGSVEQIYQTIVSYPWSFRLGLVLALVSAFLFLMTAWALYVLLRPVNSDLASLFLLLNGVGVAVHVASTLPLIAGMYLEERAALLVIGVYKTGFISAQLFFGTWVFPLGYLIYKSGFLPRVLGVLLALDGIGILIWFLQTFLFPNYRAIIYPGLAISFVAEFSLATWLLVRGTKTASAKVWTTRHILK